MTTPLRVSEHPETTQHIEAKDREIEAKEEIIRLQADEIAELKAQLEGSTARMFAGRTAFPVIY